MENLDELFSYSQLLKNLASNYLINLNLNLTKAQFAEVRQILARKSQYRHSLKNNVTIDKEYPTVFKFANQSLRPMKGDELVIYTIKIKFDMDICIFL